MPFKCLCFPVLWNFYDPTDRHVQFLKGMLRSPFAGSQVESLFVVPRTFATVQELLGIVVLVCGSPTWQLCGGAGGNLFQKDLCHRLCVKTHIPASVCLGSRFQLCIDRGSLCLSVSSVT